MLHILLNNIQLLQVDEVDTGLNRTDQE